MLQEALNETEDFAVEVLTNLGVVDILIELMVKQELYSSSSSDGQPFFVKKRITYQIHDLLGRLCHTNANAMKYSMPYVEGLLLDTPDSEENPPAAVE